MTDRTTMDRPAAVTAFALGVLLIVVSALLLTLGGGAGAKTYDVTWSQSDAASASGSAGGAGQTVTFTASAVDVLVSNVTLTITCNDNRGPGNLAAAAQVTWTLRTAGGEQIDSGTECPSNLSIAQEPHPDRVQVEADSESDAMRKVWAGVQNVTEDYVVEFQWSRAGTTGPLPIPPQGTSFSATIALTVQKWDATVNEHGEEDLR